MRLCTPLRNNARAKFPSSNQLHRRIAVTKIPPPRHQYTRLPEWQHVVSHAGYTRAAPSRHPAGFTSYTHPFSLSLSTFHPLARAQSRANHRMMKHSITTLTTLLIRYIRCVFLSRSLTSILFLSLSYSFTSLLLIAHTRNFSLSFFLFLSPSSLSLFHTYSSSFTHRFLSYSLIFVP